MPIPVLVLALVMGPWTFVAATDIRPLAGFTGARLTEVSGIAASHAFPGILWLIEDGGAGPEVHAADTLARVHGTWRIDGATNVDWEALALGPCPRGTCLYIGDIGDNGASRKQVVIYRVPEPDPGATSRTSASSERLVLTYPDGPRDAESLMVDSAGALFIVSKGRTGSANLYQAERSAWKRGSATLHALGSVPVPDPSSLVNQITDAVIISPGRALVRSYIRLMPLTLDSLGLHAEPEPKGCSVFGLEPQGEGITMLPTGRLVLASEAGFGIGSGLALVNCSSS